MGNKAIKPQLSKGDTVVGGGTGTIVELLDLVEPGRFGTAGGGGNDTAVPDVAGFEVDIISGVFPEPMEDPVLPDDTVLALAKEFSVLVERRAGGGGGGAFFVDCFRCGRAGGSRGGLDTGFPALFPISRPFAVGWTGEPKRAGVSGGSNRPRLSSSSSSVRVLSRECSNAIGLFAIWTLSKGLVYNPAVTGTTLGSGEYRSSERIDALSSEAASSARCAMVEGR